MIFFGFGSIWDKEKKTFLCKFNKNGILETEDKKIIGILQNAGYEYLDEPIQQRKKKEVLKK